MTEKKVTVRIAMEGGKVVEAELVGIGKKGAAALGQVEAANERVSKSSGAMRANVQNAAFQVQDFFVQVSGGTSATRALSQQLPQLLGSFGLFGVLAGTAAASLIPMIGLLWDTTDPVAELTKDIDALDKAMAALRSADTAADAPIANLLKDYGKYSAQAKEVLDIQRQIAEVRASAQLDKTAQSITKLFGDFDAALVTSSSAVEATDRMYALGDIMEKLGLDFNEVTPEVTAVAEALAGLEAAKGPQEQAQAMGVLRDAIIAAAENSGTLNEEAIKVLDNLTDAQLAALALSSVDIASGIAAGADEAFRLATNLEATGLGMDTGSADWAKNSLGFIKPGAELIYTAPKTRQGGGGASAAEKTQKEQMREAQQLYEQTRTDAEKYSAEQARINELMQAGAIDADTYQRALDMIGQKYLGTGDAAKFFKGIDDDIKDAFVDLALTGENAFGRIADAIKRAALEALLFGEGPLSGIFGGAASGGLLGGLFGGATSGAGGTVGSLFSFEGGGYTGGGSRTGGLDGKGGMLAMLHPQEVVTDLTKGSGSAANITFAPTIDARGADAGAVARLEGAMARVQAEFESRVIRTVNSATKRRQLV